MERPACTSRGNENEQTNFNGIDVHVTSLPG
jgi:hypothetical protein